MTSGRRQASTQEIVGRKSKRDRPDRKSNEFASTSAKNT